MTTQGSEYVNIITVDGPSGSGKGSVCRLLADRLGWHLLDSGSLYRLVALAGLRIGLDLDDEEGFGHLAATLDANFAVVGMAESKKTEVFLSGDMVGDEIITEKIGEIASVVASMAQVRESLLDRQRLFAKHPGLVADGRDMGTVVFPKACTKFYLNALAEVRAKRRYEQLKDLGLEEDYERVLADVVARDERDTSRKLAPLRPADDGIIIDSTFLSVNEVLETMLEELQKNKLFEGIV